MKYAESAYRCKMLKKAALGRMATTIKKLKNQLNFLEEVRQHLGRISHIDPLTRTLLLCGFPNVGKSQFINNISHANVDVQPYAFTTQSLYVGHTMYNNVKWQIIDSPGLLSHELDTRNTIEMQSITALAHLKACVLFLMDISETCGHTIEEQMGLFEGIKPLLAKKPHILVLTKIDIKKTSELDPEQSNKLKQFVNRHNLKVVELSNFEGDAIFQVKKTACDILLKYRLENEDKNVKKNAALKREEEFLRGGVTIFRPTKKRDNKERPAYIPPNLNKEMMEEEGGGNKKMTLKEMEEKYGGAGVFDYPRQERFILEKEEWKYDSVPEIMDGKNIIDFVDPEIEAKLAVLEAEEAKILEEMNLGMEEEYEPREDYVNAYKQIKLKIEEKAIDKRLKRNTRVKSKFKDLKGLKAKLLEKLKPTEKVMQRFKGSNPKRRDLKKILGISADGQELPNEWNNEGAMIDENDTTMLKKRMRQISRSISRKKVLNPQAEETLVDKVSLRLIHCINLSINFRKEKN